MRGTSRLRLGHLVLAICCLSTGWLPRCAGLDPYPGCEEETACDPQCNALCKDRIDASARSPNCWGSENWMCGPEDPDATRSEPSCTYTWYSTGEVWGAEGYSIIFADREKVFCANVCPYGYFILSPNLADGELPELSAVELQEQIIAEQSRRFLHETHQADSVRVEKLVDHFTHVRHLQESIEASPLAQALRVVNTIQQARLLGSDDIVCDLESVNSCGQEYLSASTADQLGDCQTIWDLWHCIYNLDCESDFDETLLEAEVLIQDSGCANYSYQPRDDCDEAGAQYCVDALDVSWLSISLFAVMKFGTLTPYPVCCWCCI